MNSSSYLWTFKCTARPPSLTTMLLSHPIMARARVPLSCALMGQEITLKWMCAHICSHRLLMCDPLTEYHPEFKYRKFILYAEEGRYEPTTRLLSGASLRGSLLEPHNATNPHGLIGWHWDIYHSPNRDTVYGKMEKDPRYGHRQQPRCARYGCVVLFNLDCLRLHCS